MLNSRIKRVEELILQELAQILNYGLRDPRIGFITVTRIRVTRDLSEALAFVSFLETDEKKIAEAMEGLDAARGYIKRMLASKITLKKLPDLHFRRDTTYAEAIHMDELFHRIEKERQAAEAEEQDSGD